MTFYGWQAIGMATLLALSGGIYVAVCLIGFNRAMAKSGINGVKF